MTNSTTVQPKAITDEQTQLLLTELRHLVGQTKAHLASTANSALSQLYWQVGERIQREVLGEGRADYGKGFTISSLSRMIAFVDAFPSFEIVVSLSRQLSWSHFVEILPRQARLGVADDAADDKEQQ